MIEFFINHWHFIIPIILGIPCFILGLIKLNVIIKKANLSIKKIMTAIILFIVIIAVLARFISESVNTYRIRMSLNDSLANGGNNIYNHNPYFIYGPPVIYEIPFIDKGDDEINNGEGNGSKSIDEIKKDELPTEDEKVRAAVNRIRYFINKYEEGLNFPFSFLGIPLEISLDFYATNNAMRNLITGFHIKSVNYQLINADVTYAGYINKANYIYEEKILNRREEVPFYIRAYYFADSLIARINANTHTRTHYNGYRHENLFLLGRDAYEFSNELRKNGYYDESLFLGIVATNHLWHTLQIIEFYNNEHLLIRYPVHLLLARIYNVLSLLPKHDDDISSKRELLVSANFFAEKAKRQFQNRQNQSRNYLTSSLLQVEILNRLQGEVNDLSEIANHIIASQDALKRINITIRSANNELRNQFLIRREELQHIIIRFHSRFTSGYDGVLSLNEFNNIFFN